MKKKREELIPAKRICQRCKFWPAAVCDNDKSPNNNVHTGAGWTCDLFEPAKRTKDE